MKVLVTGASGSTGRHLANALMNDGHEVHALIRNGGDTPPSLSASVEVARGDIWDANAVREAVDGMNQVYHLAGCFATPPRRA